MVSRMKVAYVAGPIGYGDLSEQIDNCHAAMHVAEALSRAGWATICVHGTAKQELMKRHMNGDPVSQARIEQFMAQDMEILSRCDVLVLVTEDYQHSSGTTAEVEYADEHGIPVLLADDAIALAGGGE